MNLVFCEMCSSELHLNYTTVCLWLIKIMLNVMCRLTDNCTELMEVNHEEEVVDTERFDLSREMEDVTLNNMQPAEQEVAKRLTTPIVNTYLDTKDIAFERLNPFTQFFVTYLARCHI